VAQDCDQWWALLLAVLDLKILVTEEVIIIIIVIRTDFITGTKSLVQDPLALH
jgi:hypothetical protein